jgi:hypothetical protein
MCSLVEFALHGRGAGWTFEFETGDIGVVVGLIPAMLFPFVVKAIFKAYL